MRDKPLVLILEDDIELAEELQLAVGISGFETAVCHSIKAFWKYVSHHEVDLLIIDLGLPDGYGIDVIRDVRTKSDVPIIITSGRSEIEERVAGIELGADDYLAKPYHSREIIAKLTRFLSRSKGSKFSSRVSRLASRDVFQTDDFVLDAQAMSLKSKTGQDISITTHEFLLLKAFVERPNIVLTRSSMVDFIHSDNTYGSDRTVDNLVSRIRTKLAAHSDREYIKTIRGVGYVFTADVEIAELK